MIYTMNIFIPNEKRKERNMINFDKILELDNLTLDDCISLNTQNISIELNNGKITKLVKE